MSPIERTPAPDLSRYVRRYYGFTEKATTPVHRLEGPGVDVILLFSFGHEWRIGSATDPSRPAACVTSLSMQYVPVDDVNAHHARAVAAGAEVIEELVDMPYGDRRCGCRDEQGHEWTFATPRRAEIT